MKKVALSLVLVGLFSICSCQPKEYEPRGTFYDLNAVYDNEQISKDDLINIAYYNNGRNFYDKDLNKIEVPTGVIKPLEPIDESMEKLIKEDHYNLIKDFEFNGKPITLDFVEISKYCGVYNDYVAVLFNNHKSLPAQVGVETIDDIIFIYSSIGGNRTVLWKMN